QVVTIKDRSDFVTKLSTSSYSAATAFVAQPSFVPGRGVVRLVTETANSAALDVESFGEAFLVMSVTPHKYWHITIDGRGAVPVAVRAAGTVAMVLYNPLHDRSAGTQLWIPKRTRMAPEIARLQQYGRIDTSKQNEIDGARSLAAILEQAGAHPEIIESAPGRANLVARIKGKRDGEALLLLHHIDVVAANPAEWTHPPVAAAIRA